MGTSDQLVASALPPQRELELKFELSDVDSLLAHPLLAGTNSAPKRTHSVYYDTPKSKLRAAGVTLRVRQSGHAIVQTIKADGVAGLGLFDRDEWETTLDTLAPDLTLAVGTAAETPLAKAKTAKALAPVFETLVERQRWIVAASGAEIEVVVDLGEVIAGDRRQSIAEVELELKEGPAAALFALARTLTEVVRLRLGVLTKSERGYRLLDGPPASVVKAERIALSPLKTTADAFATVAGSCVRHFRLNEPAVTGESNAEALHQARVALRRLRSAMSIFKPVFGDARGEILRTALASVSATLGEARDLDVFIRTRPNLGSRERDVLLGERDRAYREVIERLDTPAFRGLTLELAEWTANGGWRDLPEAQVPVAEFATSALDRLWRRVRKQGRDLVGLSDEARHQLRIAGKKLRYASDFFEQLFDDGKQSKRRRAFVRALEAMQSYLGELNDAVTGRALTAQLSERLALDLVDETTRDGETSKRIAAAQQAHDKLVKVGRFWR